ncbi:right-handed parallel beta-helix repeat-containing protein [Aporhodopirellula aestuarii]|uniref:Right-handed parallel beta-helix repeat-containing protein n=1 Tax=Aporhodopirellula aestuarii TaxID=2950107 RepID=A0ABT0U054_9BACT|nr:right-handed parallel beta-helix repeat-containing protein [Aporhodopirellula aestuarii]MCM2370121.1 right-handed parallel beta-helix repeat-containing protein [Aporhodopirellula aestuarii]
MIQRLGIFARVSRDPLRSFSTRFRISHIWAVVALLTVGLCPCWAAEFRIDSQETFDHLRTSTFRPGDVILFHRGSRFKGMFAPAGSGTDGNPIVVKSYGHGKRPRIDAGGKHPAGFLLQDSTFWEVNGLEITNIDGTDQDQGTLFGIYVVVTGDSKATNDGIVRHIYIDDCDIHDVNGLVAGKKRGGIHVHIMNCRATRFDDLRITNNRIRRVGGVGIGNDSSCGRVVLRPGREVTENLWTNVYVAGNHVDQTGRNNVIARCSKDAVYEFNTLANSSRFDTGHSIFCFNTDGIRIQHNEAYGNIGDDHHDRGGFDADYNCVNTFIQYNYSHDNMWFCGIMKKPNRNVTIRYNISQNEQSGLYFYGFDSSLDAENIQIYNNTHYTRKGLQAVVFPENRTPLNTHFSNNIFYFEGKGRWGNSGKAINTTFHNNLYFHVPPRETDASAILRDPRFLKPGITGTGIDLRTRKSLLGYRLIAGSPAIDRGVPVESGLQATNFFGSPIPRYSVNIGAAE